MYVWNSISVFDKKLVCLCLISWAEWIPLHKVKIDGPEPEIDVPKPFESKEIFGAPLPLEFGNLNFYGILAEDICPEQNLKDIAIEYKFLNDELIAINLVALNDETNAVSEKLTLMNYMKKSFGQFDTTQNPRSYTGYEIVEKPNKFIVYQRIPNDQGVIDEQIYISTPKLDEKLMKFMQDMEMQVMKDSQWK